MRLRLLRMSLGFAALVWGVSIYGVFASWPAATEALENLGAKNLGYDPMLDYWLRMTAGAFALLGGWYFVMALWPRKFSTALPWFGGLMIVEGFILLIHGARLHLPPFPFYWDTLACLLGGTAICYLSPAAHADAVKGI